MIEWLDTSLITIAGIVGLTRLGVIVAVASE